MATISGNTSGNLPTNLGIPVISTEGNYLRTQTVRSLMCLKTVSSNYMSRAPYIVYMKASKDGLPIERYK